MLRHKLQCTAWLASERQRALAITCASASEEPPPSKNRRCGALGTPNIGGRSQTEVSARWAIAVRLSLAETRGALSRE